jgi:hypothetical protein
MSGPVPPTVDELRHVRRRTSGTRLWTCYAGRAGTRIRSAAPHRRLTSARAAADRAGAHPTIGSAPPDQIVKPRRVCFESNEYIRFLPARRLKSMPARSKKQQMAAGAALAAQRGELKKSSLKGASKKMAESMSEKQLEDFAKTKRKYLPTKKT